VDLWGRLSNPVQRLLSTDQINQLVAEYQQGATQAELADRFGMHRRTIAAHLDCAGVLRRSAGWDDTTLAEAAALYESGASLLDVPGHQVGDRRLIGGRPPRALCRRRVL